MKKVLFLTRHYLSDNNGGANATKGFVHAFARLFDDLVLIYPEHDNEDNSNFVPQSVKCIPCFDHRSKIQKGLDVYRGRLHRLTDFVRRHLGGCKYDIIVIDHSLTAASLIESIKATGAKIITIHHNVERFYMKDNLPPLAYRLPMMYYSSKAETAALLASDINFTLTENDAQVFVSWYPQRNLHVHNIGICEFRHLADKSFPLKKKGRTFIITGSLCFKQSNRPIVEFMKNYYEILLKACPDCKLIIAGRNPSMEILDICRDKQNVMVIGNPEDMNVLLEGADYYLCPINAGSGIKLRVIDGLKHGLPILCHSVSAVGYETFRNNRQLFEYNDQNSFYTSVNQMLMADINPNDIYNTFKEEFSVESLAMKLHRIIQNVLL